MEKAELVGLLRTVLIIGLIYFGVRILMRIVLPWLMALFFKKVKSKVERQMNNQANQQQSDGFQQQGDVYVKPPSKSKKKPIELTGGEYVDFEEVD